MAKAFQCEFGNEICDSCVKIVQVFSDTDSLDIMVSVSNEE